jgi:hypothetical protein
MEILLPLRYFQTCPPYALDVATGADVRWNRRTQGEQIQRS